MRLLKISRSLCLNGSGLDNILIEANIYGMNTFGRQFSRVLSITDKSTQNSCTNL